MAKHVRQVNIVALPRQGYSGAEASSESPDGARFLLGYSWGVVDSLKQAVQLLEENPSALKGVILVAPYLFLKAEVSSLKKLILNLPGIGKALLKKVGSGAVDEMIVKSSLPKSVPAGYWRAAESYKQPDVLKRSVLEKSVSVSQVQELLRRLSAADVPVGILWGEHDQTSRYIEQVAPILKEVPYARVLRLSDAGHAIPWTHPKQMAAAVEELMEVKKWN
jgi:pimeloyl-ACP methyl ester carboxylesterase